VVIFILCVIFQSSIGSKFVAAALMECLEQEKFSLVFDRYLQLEQVMPHARELTSFTASCSHFNFLLFPLECAEHIPARSGHMPCSAHLATEVSPGLCRSLWPPAGWPCPALEGARSTALVPGVRQLSGAAHVELSPSGRDQVPRFSQVLLEAVSTSFRGSSNVWERGGVSAGQTFGLV